MIHHNGAKAYQTQNAMKPTPNAMKSTFLALSVI